MEVQKDLGWSYNIPTFSLIWGATAQTALFLAEDKRVKKLRGMWMLITIFGSIVMLEVIPTRY